MAAKKTIVKVNINCQKCKRDILKAVTKLGGIDHLALDAEKGTLTVIGDVDPVCIVRKLRKVKKEADIISVGPPKPPETKPPAYVLPPCCHDCQLVVVSYAPSYGGALCTIL